MKPSASTNRWKSTALAALLVSTAGLWGADAHALALGRLTVQSALGEPLRAEIDLPDITPAEFDSLRATPASPASFRTAGFEYNSALSGLNIDVVRRADGRAVLQIKSDRIVNDPFVDLILEANWSSGRIVRDYTLLFDPPSARQTPPPVNPAQSAAAPSSPGAAVRSAPPVVLAPPPAAAATPAPVRPVVKAPTAATPSPVPTPSGNTVVVKQGDTAGRIAAQVKPNQVSLDQMLVALMRANPEAFLRGNVNRLKAGAVLDIPEASVAEAVPAAEARQLIQAQSRDFNDFRRKLATQAPSVEVAPAERSASGKVQTQVDEKKSNATAPDKLTLSKGALADKKDSAAAEQKIAEDKQAKAQSERLAELNKNLNDLSKLSSSVTPTIAAASTPKTAETPSTATPPPVAVEAPSAPASAPEATPSVAVPVPAPVVEAAPPKAPPAPATPTTAEPDADTSVLSYLGEDPLVPMAAGGGILALLAGLGLYRWLKRRRAGHVDSSFLESRLQPDSFFGASGGQRVDTRDSTTGSSSMAYSPSQLDAGDVDPVAEADVYLAYGRDLQAEEILKEALKTNPTRAAIHAKLAEIYAKRRDLVAFNALALEAYRITQGQGPEWDRIRDLGRELDPGNTLFSEGEPAPVALEESHSIPFSSPTMPSPVSGDLDLDLDLDLPLDDDPPSASPPPPPNDPFGDLSLDLEPPAPSFADSLNQATQAAALEAQPALESPGIDLTEELDFSSSNATEPARLVPEPEAPATDAGMIEFDLDSLSLELEKSTPAQEPEPRAEAAPEAPSIDDFDDDQDLQPEDPLATKLALAEEFNAIGDADGARALVEEVIAEATGSLKTKAERLLEQLA